MKKENKMYLLVVASVIILYLLLRKPASTQTPTDTKTQSNARTVADWPVTTTPPPVDNNVCEFPPKITNLDITPDLLKIRVGGNSGTIRVQVLTDDGNFSVVHSVDLYHAPDDIEIPLPGLQEGTYIVKVFSVWCEGPEDTLLVYVGEESPTITTLKPSWIQKVDITRQVSTGDTSVWIDGAEDTELRISRVTGTPQPTGKDHNNVTWTHETWQSGDTEWSGDHDKVVRANPISPLNAGLLQAITYYFDFRRGSNPGQIFRIAYTIPAGDLSYISILPGVTPDPPVEPDPEELEQLSGVNYSVVSPDGTRKLEVIDSRRVKLAIDNSGVITDTYHEDTESGGRRTAEMFPGLYNVYYVIGTDIYDLLSEITLPKGLYYIDKIYARASLFPTKESVVNNIIGLTPENDDCFDVANLILKVV